jgi:tetrahydromethanopterin S-methyltransferase subunit B
MESAFFTSLKNAPSVKVKYNPVDPSESTLDSWPGKPAGSGLIGVGILWVAVTLIFMVLSALSRHPTL